MDLKVHVAAALAQVLKQFYKEFSVTESGVQDSRRVVFGGCSSGLDDLAGDEIGEQAGSIRDSV